MIPNQEPASALNVLLAAVRRSFFLTSSSVLAACVGLLVVGVDNVGAAAGPQAGLHVAPMSIREVIAASDRIFTGTVQFAHAVEDPRFASHNVRLVNFAIKKVLRGDIDPSRSLTLRQYAPFSPPLTHGDEGLWFLSRENDYGLVAPVGAGNGSFRVTVDPASGQHVATNDLGNAGLWGDDQTLWDVYSKAEIEKLVKDAVPKELVAWTLKPGFSRGSPTKLPVELLIALVKASK